MGKFNIFFYDPATGHGSQVLATVDTVKKAEQEVETLRKKGHPLAVFEEIISKKLSGAIQPQSISY